MWLSQWTLHSFSTTFFTGSQSRAGHNLECHPQRTHLERDSVTLWTVGENQNSHLSRRKWFLIEVPVFYFFFCHKWTKQTDLQPMRKVSRPRWYLEVVCLNMWKHHTFWDAWKTRITQGQCNVSREPLRLSLTEVDKNHLIITMCLPHWA